MSMGEMTVFALLWYLVVNLVVGQMISLRLRRDPALTIVLGIVLGPFGWLVAWMSEEPRRAA